LNLARDIFKIAKKADEALFHLNQARDAAERRKSGCANDIDS
jgi:hypothetical protein